jgi:hypothetical protein
MGMRTFGSIPHSWLKSDSPLRVGSRLGPGLQSAADAEEGLPSPLAGSRENVKVGCPSKLQLLRHQTIDTYSPDSLTSI